jgi:serine/threonine protein kinase
VVRVVGKGAFGRVLHVRNILDSRFYAVKVIKTHSNGGESLSKTLREVKLLADVEHPNIVRYYTSWFQFTNMVDSHINGEEGDNTSSSSSSLGTASSVDDPSILSLSLHPLSSSSSSSNIRLLTLFIQMELCDFTLQDWIGELNQQVNTYRRIEGKVLYCFFDLLKGLGCIHEKDYIHRFDNHLKDRDLKPGNIFWKSEDTHCSSSTLGGRNGTWKIGDFGLATWISNSSLHTNCSSKYRQSVGIGTFTYAR